MHYLKKHAVGRTIAAVKTQEDDVRELVFHVYTSSNLTPRTDCIWQSRNLSVRLSEGLDRQEDSGRTTTRQILLARNGHGAASTYALWHVWMDEVQQRRIRLLPTCKSRRARVATKVLEVRPSAARRAEVRSRLRRCAATRKNTADRCEGRGHEEDHAVEGERA